MRTIRQHSNNQLVGTALFIALLLAGCGKASSTVTTPTVSPPTQQSATATSPVLQEPQPSPSAIVLTQTSSLALLDKLPVKGRAPQTGYSRDQFGPEWSDVDHNGCDTRNDILSRDMTQKTFKLNTHDCIVLTGVLADPYSGKDIQFTRGQNTSSAVQIDHIIPLSLAWQTGAQQLSAEQRLQFANDPLNLLAVDGTLNLQKSDSDAASWLPPNKSYRCAYITRQIDVRTKYGLWVTQPEKNVMISILSACG